MNMYHNHNRPRTARRQQDRLAGISLQKRRIWYADPPADGKPPAATDASAKPPDGAQNTDNPPMIPKARFDEVIAEREQERAKIKDYEARLAKIESDGKAAEEQRLKEQGEFKKLYEQTLADLEKARGEATALKPYQEQYAALETDIKTSNDKRIKAIPDGMRKVIAPILEKMTPREVANYLTEHEENLKKPTAPGMNAGEQGDKGSGLDLTKLPHKTNF